MKYNVINGRPHAYKYIIDLLRARPKAERVLLRIRENPEYERSAGRPAVVTLLRDLYLWNRKPD